MQLTELASGKFKVTLNGIADKITTSDHHLQFTDYITIHVENNIETFVH